ncbi:MAG TPA: cation diffusion facilitator family transporter [Solirubrobacteraceae bacterium]|jgi:cation diffusion facilitator family transporter|nr:cation diffusion facilitator family transporter [Solirubrobacteraceae bacterium]
MPGADEITEAMSASAGATGERRTTIGSILAATFLIVLMLGTGLATGSLGLVSAGIESSGDVVAAVVTFFAVRLGARPADSGHPYGHRRAQNLSALAEAAILLGGGIIVAVEAIVRLSASSGSLAVRWYVFVVIGAAIAIDISRAVVSRRNARRYRSAALRSNSFHFASDVAGAVAVLVGLIVVRAGFQHGDAIAALVVAVIIFAAAGRLLFENAQVLMDTSPEAAQALAHDAIAALGPEIELDRLRLRESAGRYFADVVVAVPPGQAVIEGHAAANEVERAIEQALPDSDVVVHVEPRQRGLSLRDQVLSIALSEPTVSEAHDITIFEHGEDNSVSLHLKLPADSSLKDAHEVAERIEAAISALPHVSDVRTHLEPLERPIATDPTANRDDRGTAEMIETIVRQQTGKKSRDVRLLPTEAGSVLFITVPIGATASLTEAHRIASELEETLRERLPEIADVVVHTEP